jgi:hypothetical protein
MDLVETFAGGKFFWTIGIGLALSGTTEGDSP